MGCEIKHCRNQSSIIYYGKKVCEKHFDKHCRDDNGFDLRKEFKIKGDDESENLS